MCGGLCVCVGAGSRVLLLGGLVSGCVVGRCVSGYLVSGWAFLLFVLVLNCFFSAYVLVSSF